MKEITLKIKDREFTEHIENMQITLLLDNILNEQQREEIFKHLSQCQRCRDVLKVASELKIEHQKKREPLNNINYKKFIPLAIVSSILLTLGTVPAIRNYPDEVIFKGASEEKNFLDKSIYYWECRFNKIFGLE